MSDTKSFGMSASEMRRYFAPGPVQSGKCHSCDAKNQTNCKACGEAFCAKCMSKKPVDIPRFNMQKAVVCNSCFDLETKENESSEPWKQDPDTLLTDEQCAGNTSVEPNGEVRIAKSKSGLASVESITVMDLFRQCKEKQGKTVALKVERDGAWKEWTFDQYWDDVQCAGRAFIKLGMEAFQSVNIIGFNSPEWIFSNMAAIACGGKAAGIYATNAPEQCKYISEHSDAAIVVVENAKQLEKFLDIRDDLPSLKAIVMWDGAVPESANVEGKVPVYDWASLMGLGIGEDKDALQKTLDERMAAQKPGNCCTLIYTSGTTGPPKAVMLSHDNITWTSKAQVACMPTMGTRNQPEKVVSYLPLSHIAAQLLDIHCQQHIAGTFGQPMEVWFARPDALRGSLKTTLLAARPTFFFGVPRVWEKMEEAMKKLGKSNGGLKKAIGDWAKGVGGANFQAGQVGSVAPAKGFKFNLSNKLAFSKIKAALGLDNAFYMWTGAAPIAPTTINYFGSLDVPVCELYGMSESTGPNNECVPVFRVTGSVGRSLPGMETKIEHVDGRDKEGEGEIIFRGRNTMMGYMKNAEKTQESIDSQGWLHSGDIGRMDENGMLFITGRLKELIITAGGENVAPVPVEDAMKFHLPAISNVMMVGDKRKYNVILVTLRQTANEDGSFKDTLAPDSMEVSPESKTVADTAKDQKWIAYIEEGIKKVNAQAVSNASKVQKFAILPMDFSVPGGELTATLKLKRPVVTEKYAGVIEGLYAA